MTNYYQSAEKTIASFEKKLDQLAIELLRMPDGTTKEFTALAKKYVQGIENIDTLKIKNK